MVLAGAALWACAASCGSLGDPVDPSFGIARAGAPNAEARTHVAVGNDGRVFVTATRRDASSTYACPIVTIAAFQPNGQPALEIGRAVVMCAPLF